MNLEKLESETARLLLNVEKSQTKWQNFLRRGILFLAYQMLIALVLIWLSWESRNVIILILVSFILWELGEGTKNWLELKKAERLFESWQATVNLVNQNVE